MQLKPGTTLQNGKYRIIKSLGQGGFGITYLAEQVALGRKVAVKEFFMKDCCERDEATCAVTVGTGSQREQVEKFRVKFLREAQMISQLDHPNIVRIIDVFAENETAYYTMDYIVGGSLKELVAERGPLDEPTALKYIREVGEALQYVHRKKILHFDIKPSNIMLRESGTAALIDFGVSKHYDEGGRVTSATPVGISKGYAPMEQYRQEDIGTFTPATDIYALGATLYTLLTGKVPPDASDVYEDGLPELPRQISKSSREAIRKAMSPRRKDRPQSVEAFLAMLGTKQEPIIKKTVSPVPEVTVIMPQVAQRVKEPSKPASEPLALQPAKKKSKAWLWALLGGAAVAAIIAAVVLGGRKDKPSAEDSLPALPDSTEVAFAADSAAAASATASAATTPESKPDMEKPGSVKVSSTPSGAAIWLDGKNTKRTTPEILEDIAPGKHTVKLVLDGYEDGSGTVTVSSGQRASLTRTLTAKPVASQSQQAATPNQPAVAEKSTTGTIRNHDWVDLGLPSGLKWATCNVGASSPSDYGSYFAWGETTPKNDYSWSTLRYCTDADGDHFSKYVPSDKPDNWSVGGSPDNKKKLEQSDDAAREKWGGSWRMPTQGEFQELIDNCKWTWTTQGGKNGYKVASKTNGNSIFLPAAGWRDGGSYGSCGSGGLYWSSSLNTDKPCRAGNLYFNSVHHDVRSSSRNYGFSVRPVTK